jgi:hypothetical protein
VFAINHAATALLVRRGFSGSDRGASEPGSGAPALLPMIPLLLSVQAMEVVWVVLNLVGVERVTTEPTVRSVADIHLDFMPYSHSVATMAGVALLAWGAVRFGLGRRALAAAVGVGVLSHLVLDLVTHAPDIVLAPGLAEPRLGLGLYSRLPLAAFVLELAYGFLCWRVARGGRALLAVILLFNLANLSILSPSVPGPEALLAGRPTWIVLFIAVQIVVTLALVGRFAPSARTAPQRA